MATTTQSVAHFNRVLKQSEKRAWELEQKLVNILQPILAQAGDEAAAAFERLATDHLTADAVERDVWLLASSKNPKQIVRSLALTAGTTPGLTEFSTMIALKPRAEEAEALAAANGLDADTLHVTLALVGEWEGDLELIAQALRTTAGEHAPLEGTIGGQGQFGEQDGPIILLPSTPGLVELRVAVTEALVQAGIGFSRDHGFVPHMTVGYPSEAPVTPQEGSVGAPLHFDALLIVRADTEVIEIPFTGAKPITASAVMQALSIGAPVHGGYHPMPFWAVLELAAPGPSRDTALAAAAHPNWTAPAGDEIIDVPALVSTLRGRTDPVRVAAVETTMKASLNGVGIAYDATNPHTAKVLAQAGSQVTEIADTTQLNVMRIVKESYNEGLSIPETGKAIRSGMREASVARSVLIARTELAGAVNGGSLAATKIFAEESERAGEGGMMKQWLTSPGAAYPRHETYEGLDGQTVGMDDTFDVGGSQLQFPGDPDGPPDEICNCRCTMIYLESGGQVGEEVDAESGDGGGFGLPDFGGGGEAAAEGGELTEMDFVADVLDTDEAAADAAVDGLRETLAMKDEVPDEAAISKARENFGGLFRGRVIDDPVIQSQLDEAVRYNARSAIHRATVAEHGPERIVAITKSDKHTLIDTTSAAHRMTGNRLTVLTEDLVRGDLSVPPVAEMRPGMGSGASSLSNVFRHEYAHQVEDALSAEQKREFRADLPDAQTVKDDLTVYAGRALGTGDASESFTELYAIVSDPAYDPALWQPWVRNLGQKWFGSPTELAPAAAPRAASRVLDEVLPGTTRTAAEFDVFVPATNDLDRMIESLGPAHEGSAEFRMREALEMHQDTPDEVFARVLIDDQGQLRGAISFEDIAERSEFFIHDVGSTIKDGGTKLVAQVAREAELAGRNYVTLASPAETVPFFEKLGFRAERTTPEGVRMRLDGVEFRKLADTDIPRRDTGTGIDGLSVPGKPPVPVEQAAEIAARSLNDWPIKLGDVAKSILGDAKDTEALYSDGKGNWTPERRQLHERIVASFFRQWKEIDDEMVDIGPKVEPLTGEQLEAYFTAGGGAAGKSGLEWVGPDGKMINLEGLRDRVDTITIDPDEIKKMLPEFKRIIESGDASAASVVHEESSVLAKEIQAEAMRRKFHVVLDGTASNASFVDKKLAEVINRGYDPQVSMISIPTNEAIERSVLRAMNPRSDSFGRFVAVKPLKDAHSGASQQLKRWMDLETLPRWRVYDNTGGPKLVAEGGGGKPARILDQAKFDEILAKADEPKQLDEHMRQIYDQYGRVDYYPIEEGGHPRGWGFGPDYRLPETQMVGRPGGVEPLPERKPVPRSNSDLSAEKIVEDSKK